MMTLLQALARRIRSSYRVFMDEYLGYFGLRRHEPSPAQPEEPQLCLPF